MSSDIVLTSALRSNLLSLQNTQRLIDSTQLKLATGLKVNSALDNPTNFFTSQSLNNRAGDLTRLLDGIGQSIRTIEEADNGISALTNLVEQAQSVAQEAQSEIRSAEGFAQVRGTENIRDLDLVADLNIADGANDTFTITVVESDGTSTSLAAAIDIAAGDTIDTIVNAVNTDGNIGTGAADQLVRASVTSGGQLKIESLAEDAVIRITGSGANALDAAGFAALGLDSFVETEAVDSGSGATTRQGGSVVAGRIIRSAVSSGTQVNSVYQASDLLTDAAGGAGYITAGDDATLSLTIDGQSTTIGSFDADTQTVQDVLDGINNNATVNSQVTAAFNVDTGRIELEFAESVGQAEITLGAVAAGDVVSFGFGTGASDATFTLITDTQSEAFTFVGTSANLEQFESDYNTIRSQIDDLVEDAEFRGVNLLGGDDLVTFFNEDRSNSLTTDGIDFTALGLGVAEGDFTNAASVQNSLDDVLGALDSVRTFGQSIANDLSIIQTRRDFTEETINTLQAGADDLIVADQNEEGANLLALQTRQALGTTSLSLAAQSQQSVLRLF